MMEFSRNGERVAYLSHRTTVVRRSTVGERPVRPLDVSDVQGLWWMTLGIILRPPQQARLTGASTAVTAIVASS